MWHFIPTISCKYRQKLLLISRKIHKSSLKILFFLFQESGISLRLLSLSSLMDMQLRVQIHTALVVKRSHTCSENQRRVKVLSCVEFVFPLLIVINQKSPSFYFRLVSSDDLLEAWRVTIGLACFIYYFYFVIYLNHSTTIYVSTICLTLLWESQIVDDTIDILSSW